VKWRRLTETETFLQCQQAALDKKLQKKAADMNKAVETKTAAMKSGAEAETEAEIVMAADATAAAEGLCRHTPISDSCHSHHI